MVIIYALIIICIIFIVILLRYSYQYNSVEFLNSRSVRFFSANNILYYRTKWFRWNNFNPQIPVVIITSVSDFSPTYVKNWRKILEHPNLIRWYALHCDINHPKIVHMPLGIDYNAGFGRLGIHRRSYEKKKCKYDTPLEQEKQLKQIQSQLQLLKDRPLKAYTTGGINKTSFKRHDKYKYSRHDMIKYLANKSWVDIEPKFISRNETWKKHNNYSFILCPIGIGLDSYRTWEALLLGCIPIVQSSELDPVFEDLPVIKVKCWSEVHPENMQKWKTYILSRKWKMEKLTNAYWKKRIQSDIDRHLN